MQCSNHVKQWALAFHLYHDVKKKLPIASHATPRTPWPVMVWPYVEATNIADSYNYKVGFWEPPNTITSTLNGVICRSLPIYFCPSDRRGPAYQQGDIYWRSRGNYAINFGPWRQPAVGCPTNQPQNNAVFGFTNHCNRNLPDIIGLGEITDGTSNTLMMSELIMAADRDADWRGDMLNDDEQCGRFMTINPPNPPASLPDEMSFATYCANKRVLPCVTNPNGQVAARSFHPGGVMAALCDGSVRFIPNTIDLAQWRAFSTRSGGEPLTMPD